MNSFNEKIVEWLNKKFVPIASRIGSLKGLVAIRDGFIALMPLVIAGSLATLLNNVLFRDKAGGGLIATWFNINASDNGVWNFFGKYLIPWMGNIWWGTFAVLSLILTFTIGYSLAQQYNLKSPVSAGVVTIAGYISLLPQGIPGTWGNLSWNYLNFTAILSAVVIALIISSIYVLLVKLNFTINLPSNVPPAVGKAFAAILPGFVAIAIASFAPILVNTIIGSSNDIVSILKEVTNPLLHLGQNVFAAMVYVFFIGLFWFFGLHGGNMMGAVTSGVYLPPLLSNQAIHDGTATGHYQVFTSAFFDSYVHLGGAGASLALLIVIFLVSKRKDYREISKIALPGSIFMINEPVMYGLPVVLNPILLIPFMLVPVVLTFIAWLFTVIGIAGYTYVSIPWTTPPVIGAFLATGGSVGAAITAAINLVVAVLLYFPFVIASNRYAEQDTTKEAA